MDDSRTFSLTQLFLEPVITYTRCHVNVLDRRGLKRVSCECYSVSKKEFDRLHEGRSLLDLSISRELF